MNPEEYKIWKTAKAQGKSDAFIKGAIEAYRQNSGASTPAAAAPAQDVVPAAPESSKETPGILGSIARFTGVDKLGIGLGRAASNALGTGDELLKKSQELHSTDAALIAKLKDPATTPEVKTRIHALLNEADPALAAYDDVTTAGLSNREVIGSAAQTALNVGLAGAGSGVAAGSGKLAASAAPAVLKTGAAAVAKRIGTKAAAGFVAGGALGTAQGITDDKSLGESLKDGLVNGTVGAVLGGGLQGASELVRGLTAPQLTKKIYDSAIGVSSKTARSGQSPSTKLIKDGVVGTAQNIYDHAQNTIDDVEPKINAVLGKSQKTVKLEAVLGSLAHGVNTAVGNTGDNVVTSAEMRQVIQSSLPQVRTLLDKPDLTLAEANKLRQVMDRTLGDRAFSGATLPFKKDALLDASHALRNLVQTLAPETKPLFKDYSTSIQTIKALNGEMNKPHVLRHMLSLLASVGGGPLGLAGGIVNETAQTTLAKTATAVGLSKVNQAIEAQDKSLAAELIKKFGRLSVQNATKLGLSSESQATQ